MPIGQAPPVFLFLGGSIPAADMVSARWPAETAAMNTSRRRLMLVGGALVATLAIAITVLGADPSSPPPGQAKPDRSQNPNKPDKAGKEPEVAVTVQGTVTTGTDEKGRPTYSRPCPWPRHEERPEVPAQSAPPVGGREDGT